MKKSPMKKKKFKVQKAEIGVLASLETSHLQTRQEGSKDPSKQKTVIVISDNRPDNLPVELQELSINDAERLLDSLTVCIHEFHELRTFKDHLRNIEDYITSMHGFVDNAESYLNDAKLQDAKDEIDEMKSDIESLEQEIDNIM